MDIDDDDDDDGHLNECSTQPMNQPSQAEAEMAITSVIGQASPPHKTWCQDCSAKPRPSQAYSSLKQVSYIFGNCSQNQAQLRLRQQS